MPRYRESQLQVREKLATYVNFALKCMQSKKIKNKFLLHIFLFEGKIKMAKTVIDVIGALSVTTLKYVCIHYRDHRDISNFKSS